VFFKFYCSLGDRSGKFLSPIRGARGDCLFVFSRPVLFFPGPRDLSEGPLQRVFKPSSFWLREIKYLSPLPPSTRQINREQALQAAAP